MSAITWIKVRGYHLDVYGHVNNARYLEFLEEARWCFLEERTDLATFVDGEVEIVVTRIDIHYRKPSRLGQRLRIATSVDALAERRGVLLQQVTVEGSDDPVCEARVTFALVDPKTERSVPIEGKWRELFDRASPS